MTIPATWPRTVTAYARGDRLGMANIGEKLGLTGEPLSLFSYALSEVQIKMSVNADGTYEILEVKG